MSQCYRLCFAHSISVLLGSQLDLTLTRLCGVWYEDNRQQGIYTAEGITAIADALRVTSSLTTVWTPAHEPILPLPYAFSLHPPFSDCLLLCLNARSSSCSKTIWDRKGPQLSHQG